MADTPEEKGIQIPGSVAKVLIAQLRLVNETGFVTADLVAKDLLALSAAVDKAGPEAGGTAESSEVFGELLRQALSRLQTQDYQRQQLECIIAFLNRLSEEGPTSFETQLSWLRDSYIGESQIAAHDAALGIPNRDEPGPAIEMF